MSGPTDDRRRTTDDRRHRDPDFEREPTERSRSREDRRSQMRGSHDRHRVHWRDLHPRGSRSGRNSYAHDHSNPHNRRHQDDQHAQGVHEHGPHPDWPPHEMPSPFLSPEQMERMAWIAWRTQMLQMEHARRQFGRRQHGDRGRGPRRERPRWAPMWDQRTQSEAQAEAEMWRRSLRDSREAWGATNPPAATPWFQPQPQAWADPQALKAQAEEWRKKQRTLFKRILITFASFLVLIAGSVGVLTLVFTGLLGGNHDSALLVWIVGIGLALGLPLLGAGIARIAFVNIARPLAQVMAVADAVAGGDLSVRVPVDEARGRADDFAQLSHTINRMLDELQRTLEDRRNLTADVAHDLRTPLHIIQGNLEGILDGVYQPTPEHIGMLLEETHLLSRLIEDLRTLSLAESGYLQLHKQPVNVGELLADVSTGFGAQAEEAGVTLRVETTGFAPSSEDEGKAGVIEADAMRLNQVLANLVGNALRHTPSGGSITLLGEPIEGGVRIIVSDTGSGIAPDDLPYIFDRFWRGDVSRSHGEGAGGGLGLAIVKQLVELHGGQVHVQSALGHGTQFTVDLPTRVEEPEPHVVDLRS